MKNKTPYFLIIAFFSLLFLQACKKTATETSDDASQQEEAESVSAASESEMEAEMTNNAAFDAAMGANGEVGQSGIEIFGGRTDSPSGLDSSRSCAVVTITRLHATAPFPVRIVTDFGTTGCLGRDGRHRYGKIITEYTGRLIVPGKSATTTYDGYRVDSIAIEGTHTIVNTSTANKKQYTVTMQNGKRIHPRGNYTLWNSNRVLTQVEGLGTPELPLDDVFTITGHSSGTVKRGNRVTQWESNITEPLVKMFTCRWITKGMVKTTKTNSATNTPWTGLLNYGAGTCDNEATLTVNGITRPIKLR